MFNRSKFFFFAAKWRMLAEAPCVTVIQVVVLSRLMGGLCLLVVAAHGRHRPQRQQKLKNTGITKTSQLVALRLRSDPMNWLQSSAASVMHWAREQSMHVVLLLVVLIVQLRLGAVCFGPPHSQFGP